MKSRLWLLFVVILPVYLLVGLQSLLADDAVVGDGTPASCTESAFDAALAAAHNGGGTITFNCGGSATIVFTSQKIITTSVTIDGNDQITLSGGNSTSLFSNDADLTLQNMTMTDGFCNCNGGAIANSNNLTLNHVTIRNSTAGNGGGIYNESGTAVLTNVTLSGNSADYFGGGIANLNSSTLIVTGVTLNDNLSNYGGGIGNIFATATLTNGTLSDNSANFGGGIYNNAGTVTLTDMTLNGNSTSSDDGGGGIFNVINTVHAPYLTLKNSIVASSGIGDNCAGEAADEVFFSLWDDNSCTFTIGTGNQPNTDSLLGPLADNGGPTLTHMPLPGSPAIDMATAVGAPTTDQRGLPRPFGPGYDIGAVEVQPINSFCLYLPVVTKP